MTEKKEMVLGFVTLSNGGIETFEQVKEINKALFGLFLTRKPKEISKDMHIVGVCMDTPGDAIEQLKELEEDKKPESALLIRVKIEAVTQLHKDISY